MIKAALLIDMIDMPVEDLESLLAQIKRALPAGCEPVVRSRIASEIEELYAKLDTRLEMLPFTVRTANCLRNDDLVFVGDVIQKTDAELYLIPNFGRRSVNELKDVFLSMRLFFRMDIHDWTRPPREQN